MRFMEKFNNLADRVLMPIATKLANQRHLSAIRDGMVVAIPLSILGGVCLIHHSNQRCYQTGESLVTC
ncbi:MAG: hypothetical protein ACK5LC_17160 [Coprobacillaceae bacterium]